VEELFWTSNHYFQTISLLITLLATFS